MLALADITIELISGAHGRYSSSWGGKCYNDPFTRLYYVDGGRGTIQHHGRLFQLRKGGLYLIPSRTVSDYACSPFLNLYWIHFTAQVYGVVSLFSQIEPAFEMSTSDIPYARDLFERLIPGLKNRGPATDLEMDGIVRLLLGRFCAAHQEVIGDKAKQDLLRLRPALDYMDQHLHHAVTLAELASLLNIHPTYFSNLFARVMRVPPLTYLVRRRIERAQRLLALSDEPVKTIAWTVGYEDEFYFSRAFKKVVGVSPSAYRRQRREHT